MINWENYYSTSYHYGKTDWGNKFNNTPARVDMYAVRVIFEIDFQKYLKF